MPRPCPPPVTRLLCPGRRRSPAHPRLLLAAEAAAVCSPLPPHVLHQPPPLPRPPPPAHPRRLLHCPGRRLLLAPSVMPSPSRSGGLLTEWQWYWICDLLVLLSDQEQAIPIVKLALISGMPRCLLTRG
ncbi:formin-like protein 3 isoform X1 [Panicum virgatum]|uniref:Uncharacterized protein n=1 Tax=Panicum virgatum TaxID=38727 RepID=A0A8T0RHG5_PANVG|nr:formin-like protein 3 isoform X1 [Panicum virgatum]KAG2585532.1 hypothetical protein PVAP13_6KG394900 [Panicum virgatum]